MKQWNGLRNKRRIATFLLQLCVLCLSLHGAGAVDRSGKPRLARTGPNLISNPTVKGPAGYLIPGDAAYDPGVSRTPGSGCLRIKTPWQSGGSSVTTDYIEIAPNRKYTFAYYMYSKVWPTLSHGIIRVYDASRKLTQTGAGSRYGTTGPGVWQECVVQVTTGPNDRYVKCSVGRARFADNSGYIWVDDWYFGEGIGFEQPSSPKKAFRGRLTRVDELGNFEVFQNGSWKPFFPFSICVDAGRTDEAALSKQGLNCNTWATSIDQIQKDKDAGMMSSIDLNRWALGSSAKDYAGLGEFINAIRKTGLMDNVAFYYMDNEYYQYFEGRPDSERWEVPKRVIETVRKNDPDHPIFMLTGNFGMARMYSGLVDVVGAYVDAGDAGGPEGGYCSPLTILDNVEQQTLPLMGQMNGGINRASLYQILIAGGKGFSYWKDNVGGPTEQTNWWGELPQLRKEVNAMLPLIRQPHWTPWKLTCSDPAIAWGTRDYRGNGYAIFVNPQGSETKAVVTVYGLPYTPKCVRDYFSGKVVAPMAANTFVVKLKAHGTAVYRMDADSP